VLVHLTPTLGLLVVDRNTVAASVSDIQLSFCAYPVELPGEVRPICCTHTKKGKEKKKKKKKKGLPWPCETQAPSCPLFCQKPRPLCAV